MSCYFQYRNCCNRCRSCGCSVPAIPAPFIPQPAPVRSSVASYTSTPEVTVEADGDIPLTADVIAEVPVSRTNGVVTLQSGYYLVSYAGDATTEAGSVSMALTLNDTVVLKSQSGVYSEENGGAALSSTFVLYVPTSGSTVTLRNTGTAQANFSNVNLVIQKLNL